MKVNVYNSQRDLSISKSAVRALVRAVVQDYSEVSVYFVTRKKICELHEQFFNDPTETDCISFPLDEEHLGEVFVCPKMALKYPDPYEETALYVIHGLLHCLGYDDLEPGPRKTMRKKEKEYMALIKRLNIYLQ